MKIPRNFELKVRAYGPGGAGEGGGGSPGGPGGPGGTGPAGDGGEGEGPGDSGDSGAVPAGADPVSSGDPASMGFGGTLAGGGLGLGEGGSTGDAHLDAILTDTLSDFAFSSFTKSKTLTDFLDSQDMSLSLDASKVTTTIGKAFTALGLVTGFAPLAAAGLLAGLTSKALDAFTSSEESSSKSETSSTSSKSRETNNTPISVDNAETSKASNQTTSPTEETPTERRQNAVSRSEMDYSNTYNNLPGVSNTAPPDILGHLEQTNQALNESLSKIRNFLESVNA